MTKKTNNYGKFLLLFAGEFISVIGGGLTSFGLGLYIFQQTGSASHMALLSLLGFLPGLILKVPAGVLADRYDRRKSMDLLKDSVAAFFDEASPQYKMVLDIISTGNPRLVVERFMNGDSGNTAA